MNEGKPTIEKVTNLVLNSEEKGDLINILNIELRDDNLTEAYATRLNEVFKKLMGRDHDVWEKNFGHKE